MIQINIFFPISIVCAFAAGGGVILYFVKHPEVVEKWLSLFFKIIKTIHKNADSKFVKYNIQSTINSYIAKLNHDVPNLDAQRVEIDWIDENITPDQFLHSGNLVLRMHRSHNQSKNIINATYAFVSHEILKKAKTYLAPYQKDAIDLFVSYKVLEKAGHDIMDAFVQDYLRSGLEKDSIDKLYAKFEKIDTSGLFFPVFITEMTFLGEKIFGKGVSRNTIFNEVDDLISFLLNLANRKTGEYSSLEHGGAYSKFAIRIVGKQWKIDDEGKDVYVRNIQKISNPIETLYLIGDLANKHFINDVCNDLLDTNNWEAFHKMTTTAKLQSSDGVEFKTNSYITILRNTSVTIITR